MARKLSHALARPLAFGSAFGLVLFSALACQERVDLDEFGEAIEEGSGWQMPWKTSRGKHAPFTWPESEDHPVVEIKIASDRDTVSGRIRVELFPELAPNTTAQFLEWVENDFYMGTTFHRVIDGFMIQGGDPNSRDRLPSNDGQGGPGFALKDEFSRAPFVRGVVGMGNKGRPDSAGSQFFIMHGDQPSLKGRYTVIGRVIEGMEVVDAITQTEIDKVGRWGPKDRPKRNIVMTQLTRVKTPAKTAEGDAGGGSESGATAGRGDAGSPEQLAQSQGE